MGMQKVQEGCKRARRPASEGFHGHGEVLGSPSSVRARPPVTMGQGERSVRPPFRELVHWPLGD